MFFIDLGARGRRQGDAIDFTVAMVNRYQASGKPVRKLLMDEHFANVPWAWAAAIQLENAESTHWILSRNRSRRPGSAFKEDIG